MAEISGTPSSAEAASSFFGPSGRLVAETNALWGVTTYLEYFDPTSGRRYQTTTYPDLGTRGETNYLDGSLWGVSGTVVAPLVYYYGRETYDNSQTTTTLEVRLASPSSPRHHDRSIIDRRGPFLRPLHRSLGFYEEWCVWA